MDIEKVRNLDIVHPEKGRPPYLSAASGILKVNQWLYVVADDELHLGVFSSSSYDPGTLFRLLPGTLPLNAKERKKNKPDFEAVVRFSPQQVPPHGALCVIPSGSTKRRTMGALIRLEGAGDLSSDSRVVNFGQLYEKLLADIPNLNIEGAVATEAHLKLFQRGNSKLRQSAIVTLNLHRFLSDVLESGAPGISSFVSITGIDLGKLAGIPLSFTDAAILDKKRIVFVASAEDTDDPYIDGACVGSIMGILDQHGGVIHTEPLQCKHKVEGIAVERVSDQLRVWLVTDGDNIDIPGELLTADATHLLKIS